MKVTNFTHYEKEIRAIGNLNSIGVVKNKPVNCFNTKCSNCDYHNPTGCAKGVIDWLFQEYKEDKFITKVEKGFLESLGSGYIVRDNHDQLYWFESPPSRVDGMWECYSGGDVVRLNFLKSLELPFIKKDGDVYSVESLLELQVK